MNATWIPTDVREGDRDPQTPPRASPALSSPANLRGQPLPDTRAWPRRDGPAARGGCAASSSLVAGVAAAAPEPPLPGPAAEQPSRRGRGCRSVTTLSSPDSRLFLSGQCPGLAAHARAPCEACSSPPLRGAGRRAAGRRPQAPPPHSGLAGSVGFGTRFPREPPWRMPVPGSGSRCRLKWSSVTSPPCMPQRDTRDLTSVGVLV